MALLDEEGYFYKCDRCSIKFEFEQGVHSKTNFWPLLDHIYSKRIKPNLGDFCLKCADEVTPFIYALRDIDEVTTSANKLMKVINEKHKQRNQNNRTTQGIACQCCTKCFGWKSGYRESNNIT